METTNNSKILKSDTDIAVLGGGISGITSMKYLKENGLKADVYDSKSVLGGIWATGGEGFVWSEMTTNLCQYTCQFSDHRWEVSEPRLPASQEVQKWIKDYIDKHDLLSFHNMHFSTSVSWIEKKGEQEYELTYYSLTDKSENPQKFTKTYKHIVMANGPHSEPFFPNHNTQDYAGDFFHSQCFKNPDELVQKYKNILLVGFSISGGNISEHLANSCKKLGITDNKIHLSMRTHPFIVRGTYFDEEKKKNNTFDFWSFVRHTDQYEEPYIEDETATYELYTKYHSKEAYSHYKDLIDEGFFDYSSKFDKIIAGDINKRTKHKRYICKTFIPYLRDKTIEVFPEVKHIVKGENGAKTKTIEFFNGEKRDYDLIIYCTGFKNNMKYVSPEIQKAVTYDRLSYLFPMILCKGIYHPDAKGLYFVGAFPNVYFTGQELQSRYAALMIKGEIKYPSREECDKIIEKELTTKKCIKHLLTPWLFYSYCDMIAKDIGCCPDLILLKKEDKELYDAIMRLPAMAPNYRLFENGKLVEGEKYKELREYFINVDKVCN